jgi:NCS1 family nucleobase:cation symporter-1
VDPLHESTRRTDAIVAVATFLIGFGAAVPFMDTSLFVGPVAKTLHGADIAYFVGFVVTGALYAPFRLRGAGALAGRTGVGVDLPAQQLAADASS